MNYLMVITGILAMAATSMARHDHDGHKGLHRGQYVSRMGDGGHGSNSLDASDKLTNQQIVETVTNLITQAPTADLIKFLTALNSTDGQKLMRHSKQYNKEMISTLLKQLNGSPSEVDAAKETLKTFAASIQASKGKQASIVRQMYKVYITYQNRQVAKQMIQAASLDVIKAGVAALAAAQKRNNFGNINFANLLKTLNTKGEQGRKEVSDALNKWVDTADIKTLMRAGKIYTAAVMPATTTTTAPAGVPRANTTTTAPVYNQTTTVPGSNQTTSSPVYNQTTTVPSFNRTTSFPTIPAFNQTTDAPVYNSTTTQGGPGQNSSSPAPLVRPGFKPYNAQLGKKAHQKRVRAE